MPSKPDCLGFGLLHCLMSGISLQKFVMKLAQSVLMTFYRVQINDAPSDHEGKPIHREPGKRIIQILLLLQGS
jgi:hypothetical protein